MPNLELSSVLDWFRQEEANRAEPLEEPVTTAEAQPDVEQALVWLGLGLDEVAARDLPGLASSLIRDPLRDDFRAVMGQLGAPRRLRLLDWLMQIGLPDSDAILSAMLEPDPSGAGQYLQVTLAGAARSILLDRIFAPDRLASLVAACRPADGLRVAS